MRVLAFLCVCALAVGCLAVLPKNVDITDNLTILTPPSVRVTINNGDFRVLNVPQGIPAYPTLYTKKCEFYFTPDAGSPLEVPVEMSAFIGFPNNVNEFPKSSPAGSLNPPYALLPKGTTTKGRVVVSQLTAGGVGLPCSLWIQAGTYIPPDTAITKRNTEALEIKGTVSVVVYAEFAPPPANGNIYNFDFKYEGFVTGSTVSVGLGGTNFGVGIGPGTGTADPTTGFQANVGGLIQQANANYLPERFTCGPERNPLKANFPITLVNLPDAADSISITFVDTTTPFKHWTATKIKPARNIGEGETRTGGLAAFESNTDDFGGGLIIAGYGAPCPPAGEVHFYLLTVTANNGDTVLGTSQTVITYQGV